MRTDQIGNYIHWKYSNYLRYGLGTRENPDKSQSWSQAYNNQKIKILTEVSSKITSNKQLKEIENNLNYFRIPAGTQNLTWGAEKEQIQEEIIRIIIQSLKIDPKMFDFNSMDWTTQSAQNFFERGGKSNLAKKGQAFYGESVQDRLNIMTKGIEAMQMAVLKGQLSQNELNNFQSKLEALKQQWAILQNTLSFSVEQSNLLAGANNTQGTVMKYNISKSQEGKTFINDLNTLWQLGKKNITASIKGMAAEQWAVLTNQVLNMQAFNSSQEILNYLQGLDGTTLDFNLLGGVGQNRSSAALNKSFFSSHGGSKSIKQVGKNELFNTFGMGNSRFYSTQDKVDITIQLNNLNINGSVKNYSQKTIDSHGYSIHTGRSILSLVQEYTTFVNHYLNITAQHQYQNAGPSANVMEEAQFLMKLTIALKSLQGGIYKFSGNSFNKSAVADIFITIENGLYKVYSMSNIINNIANNIDLVTIKNFPTGSWPSNAVGDWVRNPNYPEAYSRINKLLSQLHRFKLEVSISPAALTKFES